MMKIVEKEPKETMYIYPQENGNKVYIQHCHAWKNEVVEICLDPEEVAPFLEAVKNAEEKRQRIYEERIKKERED